VDNGSPLECYLGRSLSGPYQQNQNDPTGSENLSNIEHDGKAHTALLRQIWVDECTIGTEN